MQVDRQEIVVIGKVIKTARITEEWYHDIEDPASLIEELKESDLKADIFTFWQRLPETQPKYNYYMEWDSIAVLPIESFDYWWEKQINAKTRNVIRKAKKKGVVVRTTDFDDNFVIGMTRIFNETPVRQGKPFWHYGKDFKTVKREFSRYLFREELIGAYFKDELIGFIMLANAGKYAVTGQLISKIAHRDKSPSNALVAKAVEICSEKRIPYLVYAKWHTGTLGDFKRHNGFQKIDLPRYYVPLTIKGKLLLPLNLHHGVLEVIPEGLRIPLTTLRKNWYSKKSFIH